MTSDSTPTTVAWMARIHVTLKPAVVDPQGNTIADALHQLHFTNVSSVRMGKYLEVTLDAHDETSAHEQVEAMCVTLLANPVIERYTFTLAQVQQ